MFLYQSRSKEMTIMTKVHLSLMPGLVAKAVLCLEHQKKSNHQIQTTLCRGRKRDREICRPPCCPQTCLQLMSQENHRHLLVPRPCSIGWRMMLRRDLPDKCPVYSRNPPQCATMWWSDGKEGEVEQFEHYEETWNWRF